MRLPLQTGASALRDVAAATLAGWGLIWLGVAVGAGGVAGAVAEGSASMFFGGPFLGIVIIGSGLGAWISGIVSAQMHRASDLDLDAEGFTVRGGRKDGLAVAFAGLKPSDCQLEAAVSGSIRSYFGQTHYKRAFYLKTQGDIHLVAETAEDDEEASVTGLVEAIEARIQMRGDQAARPALRRDLVVVCPSCGACVVPVDAEVAPCAQCGASTPMPAEVRARLVQAAAERSAHAALDRAVVRIVAQPGASRINVSLWFAGMLAGVAALVGPIGVLTSHPLAVWVLVGLASAAFWTARAQIERRRALRDVTLRFAAHTDDGGTTSCRVCGGPLPSDTNIVARCPYCGAANVRGLDFGRRATAEASSEREISAYVGMRARRAALAWTFTVGSLVVGALGAAAVR